MVEVGAGGNLLSYCSCEANAALKMKFTLLREEGIKDAFYNMDEPRDHYVK